MYSHVVLGGTFDQLHVGHLDLLSFAFSKSSTVTLGLTKASMNGKKDLAQEIQSFRVRQSSILRYTKQLGRDRDLTILPINDIYGTARADMTLEAIFVTPHSLSGATQINREREKFGLAPLRIEICPLRTDTHGEIISSSRIRRGEIDREGIWYADTFRTDVVLSEIAKQSLRRPFGKVAHLSFLRQGHRPIIVIGDIATEFCCRHEIAFRSAFIDGNSRRTPYLFNPGKQYRCISEQTKNNSGTISSSAASLISSELLRHTRTIIQIIGEEDLLAVACMILLPIGTKVVYGYPYKPESMRVMTVTPRSKNKFKEILCR